MEKYVIGCESFDVKLLRNRTTSAINWYMSLMKATTSTSELWTSLKPSSIEFDLSILSREELKLISEEVFNFRLKSLENIELMSEFRCKTIYKSGHLGIFFPEMSVLDGVPRVVSKGFFNAVNYPPFGTWLYFIDENQLENPKLMHLVFWIPPNFVKSVRDAISSCPDDSLVLMTDAQKICYKDILNLYRLLI